MKLKKFLVTFAIIAVFAVLSISISANQIFNSDKDITLGIKDVDSKPIVADAFSDLTQAEIDKIVEDANIDEELVVPQKAEEEILESSSITRNAFDTNTITEGDAQCEYRITDDPGTETTEVVITKVVNNSTVTNLYIPYHTTGMNVVGIDDRAFEDCTNLTSVDLSESRVTSIGQSAFHGCTALSTVKFPTDTSLLTYIGGYAFLSTPWLKYQRAHSPQALVVVNGILIDGITAKEKVTIANSDIKQIAPFAFAYNSKMTELSITNETPVSEISYRAFTGCKALKKVTLSSITTVGSHAFFNCSTIENVVLDNVITIENSAFNKCTGLKTINWGETLETIGNNAFAYCKGIENINLPTTIQHINTAAFLNCTGAKTLNIPGKNDVEIDIGQGAFMGCTKLGTIALSTNITSIDKGAFLSCPIAHASLPAQYLSAITTKTSLREVTVTAGTTIVDNVFKGASLLTTVNLPDTIASIGTSAFEDCEALTDIVFAGTLSQWTSVRTHSDADYNLKRVREVESETVKDYFTTPIVSCVGETDKVAL